MPRAAQRQPPGPVDIRISQPAPEPEPKVEEKSTEKPPRWFFDQIEEIPKNDWGRLWSLELYRLKPDVPGVAGSKGYLALFNEPVTLAQIKATRGGGKFRLNLCKNGRWITSHEFDIEGEPIYDLSRERPGAPPAAVAGAADNRLLEMLDTQIKRLNDEIADIRARGEQVSPASERALDVLTGAYKRASEIQIGNQADPVAQLKSLAEAGKSLGIFGGGGGMSDALMKVLLEKVLTPPDPMAQLTTFITLFEKMDSLRGAPGKADWRSEAISAGRELLPQVLETISTARAPGTPRQAPPRYAPQRAPQPQPPARPMPSPGPSAAPAPGAAANGGGLRMVPMDEQPGPTAPEVAAQPGGDPFAFVNEDTYMAAVKQRIIQVVRAPQLTPEYAGDMLVDGLEMMWPDMLEQLKILTEEQITAFLSRDPILMYATQDPRWPAVLHCAKTAAMEAALDEAEDETPKPQRFKN